MSTKPTWGGAKNSIYTWVEGWSGMRKEETIWKGGGGLNTEGGEMFPGGRKNNVWGPFRLPAYQHWHSYWELHTGGPWTFPSHIVNMGPEPSPVPHIPPPNIKQGPWTFPCTTHAPRIKHGSWTFPCTTHPPYKNLGPGPSPVPQISL